MSDDERTLATEVREFFQALAKKPDRRMDEALANLANTAINSDKFYTALAVSKGNCAQLIADIQSSRLKERSKTLYAGAVTTLATYLDISTLQAWSNANLRAETQAFEYLTLVDDNLEPLDSRNLPGDFLTGLKKQAQDMAAELDTAELEPRLKAFLSAQISQFLWSVQNHHIVGIEGISRAWGAMAAEVQRSQGMEGATKAAAKGWYKKSVPILMAIGAAVTTVSAKVESVDNLLTQGPHIVQVLVGQAPDKSAD